MLLDNGNINLRQLLEGDPAGKPITHIAVGTSNTPVAATDTALTNAVVKLLVSATSQAGGKILFIAQLAANDPAATYQEMGLVNAAGVLCHRQLINPFTKVAGVVNNLNYEITVY